MMNKIYQKNIGAIQKRVPDLANWIKDQKPVDWIKPIKSKNGDANFIVYQNGTPTTAYNIDDAKKDSEDHIKDRKILKEDVTVLIGFGLGYMTNELIEQAEKKHHIVVIEPVASVIKMALSQFDFSKYLASGQLTIVAPGVPEVYQVLSHFENQFVIRHWDVIAEHYIKVRPEYSEISVKTLEIINSLRCNTGTVASNGGIIASNDIESLPYLIRHRGIIELKDLFKDKPAVIVSTGPSLEKNIHHLIEWQDKVIIVAVGQALRPLLAYGVRPDFICTVDFGEVNMGHFEGILDSDVPLICLNRAYAPLLKKYQGPKFVVATPNPGYENTTADILAHRGSIDQYGSVAHLCLGSAYLMGCDPIILIGQDLAYPDTNMKSHFNQADEMGDIEIDQNNNIIWKVTDKKSILHGKQDYNFGQYVSVAGYYGKPVKTNVGLASFINGFQNQIQSFDPKRTIINSTQGGARIEGARQWALITALKNFARGPVDKSILAPLLSYAPDGNKLVEEAMHLICADIGTLKKIIFSSKAGLKTNKKLHRKNLTDKQIAKALDDNKVDSIEACKQAIKIPLVNVAIFGANREIHTRELAVKKLSNKDNKIIVSQIKREDLEVNLKRNKLILTAAKNAAQQLLRQYAKTFKLLENYSKSGKDELLRPKIPQIDIDDSNFEQFEKDFATGNFSRPLLTIMVALNYGIWERLDSQVKNCLRRAIKMRGEMIENAKDGELKQDLQQIRYNDLIEYAQQVGRDNQDWSKAESLLNEALKINPKGEEVRFGLACLCQKTKNNSKSSMLFEKLIEEFPKNQVYLFEYGAHLITIGLEIDEGLKLVLRAMELTKKYDHFFKYIGKIYHGAGKYEKALIAYSEYLKLFPSDLKVWELALESSEKVERDDIRTFGQLKESITDIKCCKQKICELKDGERKK